MPTRLSPVTADQPMMKAKEIHTLASHGQFDDPGLRRLGFQPQLGQQDPKPRQRSFGLHTGRAHHHHVISEADQHPMLANVPGPIDPLPARLE